MSLKKALSHIRKDSRKSRSPILCQWGNRGFVQVLAICSAQVPAGRRINFEDLALQVKQF